MHSKLGGGHPQDPKHVIHAQDVKDDKWYTYHDFKICAEQQGGLRNDEEPINEDDYEYYYSCDSDTDTSEEGNATVSPASEPNGQEELVTLQVPEPRGKTWWRRLLEYLTNWC